jgi:hypothetical protein
MPGVKACGRCRASLQMSTMAINVHPPRAGAWAKRLRRWFWWPNVNWRGAAAGAVEGLMGRDASERPAWPLMVRMIVPGWPQIYQGHKERGWSFLGSFAALAVLALAMLGTVIGSICLGLAVAAHASSVIDVVLTSTRPSRTRIIYALVCLVGVGELVYWPLSHVASGLVVPRRMAMTVPPFFRGDVVLMSPATYSIRSPRPGDVVLYDIPMARIAGRTPGNFAANYAIAGQRIDRILAGPGQQARIEGGKLIVDGQPSPYLPLNPAKMPGAFDRIVPPGNYLILPSTALPERFNLTTLDWEHLSLVPAGHLHGRVYVRNWPWWRFKLL